MNLGGVGNITWVDARLPPEQGLLAFDTGPANAPLNDFILKTTAQAYDADGALAASGRVDTQVVASFMQHPYFARPAPKSLDRDGFGDMAGLVAQLSAADGAATLTAICVAAVAGELGAHARSAQADVDQWRWSKKPRNDAPIGNEITDGGFGY